IEMSNLPSSVKKKLTEMMQPPPEAQQLEQQAAMIKLAQEQAKAEKTQAETYKTTTDGMLNEQQLGMPVSQDATAPQQGMQAPSQPQAQAPAASPVTIAFDANQAMAGVAEQIQGMAAQNNDFIGQAAQSLAQSAQMMAEAVQVMSQTAQVSSQASAVIADAAARMSAPKRITRDPVTGRATGVEAVM
ncbi:MAG: hypothetical protein ACK5QX_08850, partial [bacterium]